MWEIPFRYYSQPSLWHKFWCHEQRRRPEPDNQGSLDGTQSRRKHPRVWYWRNRQQRAWWLEKGKWSDLNWFYLDVGANNIFICTRDSRCADHKHVDARRRQKWCIKLWNSKRYFLSQHEALRLKGSKEVSFPDQRFHKRWKKRGANQSHFRVRYQANMEIIHARKVKDCRAWRFL